MSHASRKDPAQLEAGFSELFPKNSIPTTNLRLPDLTSPAGEFVGRKSRGLKKRFERRKRKLWT
jgi:hypothetical protein